MKHKIINALVVICLVISGASCTKIGKGFLSPYMIYNQDFTVIRGRFALSQPLSRDGSSQPLNVQFVHAYNSNGDMVDDIFTKTKPIDVWTAAYNAKADTNFALIRAKLKTVDQPPIVVNPDNGIMTANAGTLSVPVGIYFFDLQVSNAQGTELLKKVAKIIVTDGPSIEISPETGAFSLSLLNAGTAGGAGGAGGSNNGVLFNGNNNPFVDYQVTRVADTPNVFVLKVTDRNGVVFNPAKGEIAKRPNSGLNPNPPFLQNLQDYAPDTFKALDTAMTLRFPLVPFPINSLGNGYNMYYKIGTQYVQIDSTSSWGSNTPGNFYQGTADPHYKGVYTNGRFDFAVRVPMRIYVAGSYVLNVRLLCVTHR